jgi:RNA polymerase sigma-70 factor (ECF subfamily)
MVPEATRASLLSRLRDGSDDRAWWEFDQLYRELILRYCRECRLQEADAEDVRQVVMMNLARALPGFRYDRERGRFRAYLRTTIRHAIQTHFRRPNRELQSLGSHVEGSVPGDGDPVFEHQWMLHHFRTAMKTIRKTFEARSVAIFDALLQGRSVDDVAAGFGVSQQAVHKVKQRVRNRLRDLIAAQIREEEP